jgi:hypothetical protein
VLKSSDDLGTAANPLMSSPAEIAKHIKSLAPRTLVMDGSFAKADRVEDCYAKEALKSKDVDVFDYHYYGSTSGRTNGVS